MTRVHVLTPGFTSPNGCAFLFPLIVHRRALAERGIGIAFFHSDADPAALTDCDVLIVDGKYYSPRWIPDTPGALDALARLGQGAAKLFYFDITDSSGWDHARGLPLVAAYFKNQLLRDRTAYLRPLYGYRPYSDHYHRTQGVTDAGDAMSEPIDDPALLDKLHVGWNSALADYSWLGPARMALYGKLPWPALLRFPDGYEPPGARRPLPLACRIGTAYARDSVAWQRHAIAERLAGRVATGKVSRRAYLAELRRARVVVSPFGLGEITLRDFEIFLAGAVALKPRMTHLETWPDLFRDGETIAVHGWDLDDLDQAIERLLDEPLRAQKIAARAQADYRRHLIGEAAAALFCDRFATILATGTAAPAARRRAG